MFSSLLLHLPPRAPFPPILFPVFFSSSVARVLLHARSKVSGFDLAHLASEILLRSPFGDIPSSVTYARSLPVPLSLSLPRRERARRRTIDTRKRVRIYIYIYVFDLRFLVPVVLSSFPRERLPRFHKLATRGFTSCQLSAAIVVPPVRNSMRTRVCMRACTLSLSTVRSTVRFPFFIFPFYLSLSLSFWTIAIRFSRRLSALSLCHVFEFRVGTRLFLGGVRAQRDSSPPRERRAIGDDRHTLGDPCRKDLLIFRRIGFLA